MNEPYYETTVEHDGFTTIVRTYCSDVPDDFEGTCADFHLRKIRELIDG